MYQSYVMIWHSIIVSWLNALWHFPGSASMRLWTSATCTRAALSASFVGWRTVSFTAPQRGIQKGMSSKKVVVKWLNIDMPVCSCVGSHFSHPRLGDSDYFINKRRHDEQDQGLERFVCLRAIVLDLFRLRRRSVSMMATDYWISEPTVLVLIAFLIDRCLRFMWIHQT